LLGLDGEPRQSAKYCSMQLGHADEQMVMKIYSKANLDQRLRMIELAEARRSAA
jgi:integrase